MKPIDSPEDMHKWARDLYPVTRSITGPGVRETLDYIGKLIPELRMCEVPSGTRAFDWIVPDEWFIRDAYIADEAGSRVVDFQKNNLHIVGYSEPVDCWMEIAALEKHLYSLPEQPEAIPYVTSYYKPCWGFCIAHQQRKTLRDSIYHVVIDSELTPGVLNYGEIILPGQSAKEVFLSTYICHPSMANNELSGPVVTTALAQWLSHLKDRFYTYRIIFIPETIGSLVYLSQNLEYLKAHVIAGFNITCIGDDRCYSYLPSRDGNTRSDRAALHVLHHIDPKFKRYKWLDRGSDERQYCAPGIDLPIATIMRSKYGEYPEYHTSLDDLSLVTPEGLMGGYRALRAAIEAIEKDVVPTVTVYGEPQLGKRGLYPTLRTKDIESNIRTILNLISYCDGTRSLLEIADLIDTPFWYLHPIVDQLSEHGLISQNSE